MLAVQLHPFARETPAHRKMFEGLSAHMGHPILLRGSVDLRVHDHQLLDLGYRESCLVRLDPLRLAVQRR